MHISAIFAKIWDPKIWDNSGDLSRSTRLHVAGVGSAAGPIEATQGQACKFRCFFAQNWRALVPNYIRAIFKKRKNRRNWRSLVPKYLRGRGFELKWRCFFRVLSVLPRTELYPRDSQKRKKKEQTSAKNEVFGKPT